MDTMEFINKALSKDKTRENLQRAYRLTDKIAATDGHRLHIMTAPLVEKEHFIDGYDGNFPDISFLTNDSNYKYLGAIINTDGYKALKALIPILKTYDKQNNSIRLKIENNKLYVIAKFTDFNCKLLLAELSAEYQLPEFEIGLNGKYLFDALPNTVNFFNFGIKTSADAIRIQWLQNEAFVMPINPKYLNN